MKILISPFAKAMRDGKENPKNFPYWDELIFLLKHHEITQIGVVGERELCNDCRFNLSLSKVAELIKECDLFISVDTFLPHAAQHYNKCGIVIFSRSSPTIFGYPNNINMLKDVKYLRPNKEQFYLWEQCTFNKDSFVSAKEVYDEVCKFKITESGVQVRTS